MTGFSNTSTEQDMEDNGSKTKVTFFKFFIQFSLFTMLSHNKFIQNSIQNNNKQQNHKPNLAN